MMKSIVFAVMAPIEEHGIHLPLATDLLEGEYWSKCAADTVERITDAECYCLPAFPIAAASVNEFYGSFHFSMKTTYEVAYGVKVAEAHKILNNYASEHKVELSDRVYEVYNKDMSVDVYYALQLGLFTR